MKCKVFTDGGSRGNPGDAGIGVLILDEKNAPIEKRYKYLGTTTNNIAEYMAVLLGLERVIELGGTDIHFYLDSKLVVSQLSGEWKVKNDGIKEIYSKICEMIASHKIKIQFEWVPREKNKEADRLANKAMDEKNNT